MTTTGDQVIGIAQELFDAMVDDDPGQLSVWEGPTPLLEDPLHAWVDATGASERRTLVSAEAPTCRQLAVGLLAFSEAEAPDEQDVRDAMGELANIVGGNIKSLSPGAGMMSPPGVDTAPPPPCGPRQLEVCLRWRGAPIIVSLWGSTDDTTEE